MVVGNFFRKIGIRFTVATLVFLCIKITSGFGHQGHYSVLPGIFYYLSALFFFMVTWEVNDWMIKRHLARHTLSTFGLKSGMKIMGITLICVLPVYALVYYIGIFHFPEALRLEFDQPGRKFRLDFLRAGFLAVAMIILNLFYFETKVKRELERRMAVMEKEIVSSKYKGLRSQISPHFLFNSLNTLTSLMYQDRDLASDFVSRLASCYRYILDNREVDLVGLDNELAFLDSFIFMMDVRHKKSLEIITDIDLDPGQFVIPTLSLQMLLENALKHNYFSEEQPLRIRIVNEGHCICVENTLRKRKKTGESTQLGLENIKKRYSFYTDERVMVKEENGIFSVAIPLLKKCVEQRVPLHIVS